MIGLLLAGAYCAPAIGEPATAATPAQSATAKDKAETDAYLKEQVAKLHPQHGHVELMGGEILINLPESLAWLPPEDTALLLSRIWANPGGTRTLGAVFPAHADFTSPGAWAAILTYSDSGHVKDDDAGALNADELMARLQRTAEETNAARKKNGYAPVTLIGWAQKPRYDPQAHKLDWAQEFAVTGAKDHSVSDNIRILGRHGVLSLSILSTIGELPEIQASQDTLLASVNFSPKFRYNDFNPATDRTASYGVSALIAGLPPGRQSLLNRSIGIFTLKQYLAVIIVCVIAWLSKRMGIAKRRRKEEEPGGD